MMYIGYEHDLVLQYTKSFAKKNKNTINRLDYVQFEQALNKYAEHLNATRYDDRCIVYSIKVHQGTANPALANEPESDALHWQIRLEVNTNILANKDIKALNKSLMSFIDQNTRFDKRVRTVVLVKGLEYVYRPERPIYKH